MNHEIPINCIEQKESQVLDFETIQNPWGPSPKLKENCNCVTSLSEDSLIQWIGEWLSVESTSIALGANGSTEIINLIPKLFLKPGGACVVVTPTYFGLYESIKKAGNPIAVVKTHPESGFAFDAGVTSHLFTASDRLHPSLIWLCTPNNPTGVTIDPAIIDRLASLHPDALIVVDEAYQEIIDPKNTDSMIRRINKRKNILVTKTFSKAWGLPEIKIGIAIGNESLIRQIRWENIRPPINERSLLLAHASLLDADHLEVTHERMKHELSFMRDQLSAMKHISFGSKSETGVCILRHDAINLGEALLLRHIRSLNCDLIWGLEGLGFTRIGLQTHEKNMKLVSHLWQLDS